MENRVDYPSLGQFPLGRLPSLFSLCLIVLLCSPVFAGSAFEYEEEPIKYSASPVDDAVAHLQSKLDEGAVQVTRDDQHGYLKSVLQHLKIPISSQVLVFSKTSFQRHRISPRSPRALYFNDHTYIGWVQGGEVLEVASMDPRQGAIFYTLSQKPASRPTFVRQTHECLQCHDSSSFTGGVPGLFVRSVYPDSSGQPILTAGTFNTTHQSPLKERWGGWYATGRTGQQRHMGNMIVHDEENPGPLDLAAGVNVTDLSGRFPIAPYASPHSDIVALMVLEHQVEMHNLLTRASYHVRVALRDEADMNRALGRPGDYRSESTLSRIRGAAEPLLKYLFFAGEAPLSDRIEGTSKFAQEFTRLGPCDHRGRSLREFDFQHRLFRHPCSYLIYSEQFEALPEPLKDYIYGRLGHILSATDNSSEFAHLSAADRTAIREILCDTKPVLATFLHP